MRAIFTKYIGPTNSRGSRIKAYDREGHSATVSYNYAGTDEERHREALQALCDKMGWSGSFIAGGTKEGYVWVFTTFPNGEPLERTIIHPKVTK